MGLNAALNPIAFMGEWRIYSFTWASSLNGSEQIVKRNGVSLLRAVQSIQARLDNLRPQRGSMFSATLAVIKTNS